MKSLTDIFPPKVQVKFGSEEIEVKSVKLQDMAIVAELGEKLFSKLIALFKMGLTEEELGMAIAQEIISILKNDTNLLIKFLSVTTSVPEETLKNISIEAALFLTKEVIEVNKDFLYLKIMPQAKELASLFGKKTNGQKPSKD